MKYHVDRRVVEWVSKRTAVACHLQCCLSWKLVIEIVARRHWQYLHVGGHVGGNIVRDAKLHVTQGI
jgi:hypothetical protein